MWTARVYLKCNKTAKQSARSKIILLFTLPLIYSPSICSCQTLSAQTAVPLNLLTMQSHPHTLEIPDSFLSGPWKLMDFRKFGFLQYQLYFNNFYSFNFNLFCSDNLNLIRIKFLSLAPDHLSHLRGPQVEKRWFRRESLNKYLNFISFLSHFCVWSRLYKAAWYGGKALDAYSGGSWFESRPGYPIFPQTIFVACFSPSDQAKIVSSPIPFNKSSVFHPIEVMYSS
jgi:hypothetical protein